MKFNRLITSSLVALAAFNFTFSAFAEDENSNALAPENTTELQDSSMPDSLPPTDNVGTAESTPPAHNEVKPHKKSKKTKQAKKSKKTSKKKKKTVKNKSKKKRHKNAA